VNVESATISPSRAERPLVMAIDIGSSSIRIALHDRNARTLRGTTIQLLYGWDVHADGSVRLHHEALIDLFGQAFDGFVSKIGALADEVVAGGISCFFHSIAGLNGASQPITPVLSWADTTSAGEAANLRERIDAAHTHACTGAPIHASYWPARILKLRAEYPKVSCWAGFPELLAASLTGRAVVSRSMASGTGLFDRSQGAWSKELFDYLALESTDLPLLVDDHEAIGRLKGKAAARWPSLAHITWFAPWGDGACNNVGLSTSGPGMAALMVGTSGAMRVLVADPAPAIPSGLFAYRLGPGAVVGGQLSEAGGLLAWVSRQLGRSSASLERGAGAIQADAHGLTVLPFVFGERGLGYHDNARGTIVGLAPDTDAASIYRAIVESIAFSFAAVDDELSSVLGGSPTITASGGALTRSPLLTQVIADTIGRDLTVTRSLEASLRGAALLALQSHGELADVRLVAAPPGHKVCSDAKRLTLYRAARERRDALYAALLCK